MTLYAYEIPMVETKGTITEPYDDYFQRYGSFLMKGLKQWKPYTGEFIAPPTQAELEAINLRLAQAPEYRDLGAGVIDLGKRTAAGEFLDIRNNPYATAAFEAAVSPVKTQLFNEALPRITSESVERGSYSGIRPQLAKVAATQAFGQVAGDITSKMALDIYGKERQFQLAAPELLKGGAMLQDIEGYTLASTGTAQRSNEQSALQNELLKWEAANEARFKAANMLAPSIAAMPRPMTTYGPYTGPNWEAMNAGGGGEGGSWAGAASGAVGGAVAGGMAGSAMSGMGIGASMGGILGPIGAIAGALIGGIAGYFG